MEFLPPSRYAHSSVAGGVTLRERVLRMPDFYIGSVKKRTQKLWLLEGDRFTHRKVRYVPGLLKIFDDILVYAADNKQRDPSMDTLRVDVDVAKCRISVYNSGGGIPIEFHREESVYVHEMIFGDLNNCYCKAEITGVKVANIFSTEFIVETADGPRQKKYKQVFSENMGNNSGPQISDYRKGVNWTMVTFKPDLAKFNMTNLEDDVVALMKKRVFDMAAILGETVQVAFNGQKMPQHTDFAESAFLYVWLSPKGLHLPWFVIVSDNYHHEFDFQKSKALRNCVSNQLTRASPKGLHLPWWEVCVSLSGGQFQQVSFVNKFATAGGGTHVDYVTDLIVSNVLSSEVFGKYNLEKHDVKRHLWLFINVYMDNPTFDSPTKETLITPQEDFGSKCPLSDHFFKKVRSSELATRLFPRSVTNLKKASGRCNC